MQIHPYSTAEGMMKRYAILSDIHGNLPALEAVVADIDKKRIDALFYLGDAVGYGPDSSRVIDLLTKHVARLPCIADGYNKSREQQQLWLAGNHEKSREQQQLWLAGNHEFGLLEKADLRLFSQDARITLECTRTELEFHQMELLSQLPCRIEVELGGGLTATLVHASATDPVGTNHYITSAESAAEEFGAVRGQLALVGHTHYPRVFYETDHQVGNRTIWNAQVLHEDYESNTFTSTGLRRCFLNPGSVGQPRDGDPRAAYGLLDVQEGGFTFTVHRVTYDVARAQQCLREWIGHILTNINTPGGLAGRLATGH